MLVNPKQKTQRELFIKTFTLHFLPPQSFHMVMLTMVDIKRSLYVDSTAEGIVAFNTA